MLSKKPQPPIAQIEACPGCGSRRQERLPAPGHWIGEEVFARLQPHLALCRCRRCSLVFANPRPGQESLERFYASDEYACHDANDGTSTRLKAELLLGKLASYPPVGRRLLDFGAGGGWLLQKARHRGWEVTAYDIGARSLETCRQRGIPVVERLESLRTETFDAIVLHHVLEHLPDPGATLGQLAGLLAPGGMLFIEVPNARSLRAQLSHPLLSRHFGFDERYRAFPIHLYYFSPRSLCTLISRHGLEVRGIETYGLGLDELLRRAPVAGQAYAPPPTVVAGPTRSRPLRWIKEKTKGAILGRNLGECLLAVATPAG